MFYYRKILSIFITAAILATPIELAVGNECHCGDRDFSNQGVCGCNQEQEVLPCCCCCEDLGDMCQDEGIGADSKGNDSHKNCPCRYAFMVNSATGIVVSQMHISMDVAVSVHQYCPDTYHSSDWVSTLFRPPII
ncbi:MAG: hypothetical protein GY869_09050 [Planctomycetes bacterium]|nr:hypothetical protein [Planctomycetota bacterium]